MTGCISTPGPSGTAQLGLVDYSTIQSDTFFTTTSTTYVSTGKVLTTPVLAGGSYRVGIFNQVDTAGSTIGGDWNVLVDGSFFLFPTTQTGVLLTGTTILNTYRARLLALSAAVHTFDLRSRSQAAGFNVDTRSVMMEIWKALPSFGGKAIEPCVSSSQNIVQSIAVAGRVLTTRTLVTPALAAGTYRIRCDYCYELTAATGEVQFNLDLDLGGNMFPTSMQEGPALGRVQARTLVRQVVLGAGVHTFTLVLNSTATNTVSLKETSFYLQRVL